MKRVVVNWDRYSISLVLYQSYLLLIGIAHHKLSTCIMLSKRLLSEHSDGLGTDCGMIIGNDGSSLATREAIDKFKETKATSKLGV